MCQDARHNKHKAEWQNGLDVHTLARVLMNVEVGCVDGGVWLGLLEPVGHLSDCVDRGVWNALTEEGGRAGVGWASRAALVERSGGGGRSLGESPDRSVLAIAGTTRQLRDN